MISLEDFQESFSKIDSFQQIEIQFGKIINDRLFNNYIDNIDKIIGLIKHKQIPHKYFVSNIYHEPGYYYIVYSDGPHQTFKKSFQTQRIDLISKPDLRIIIKKDNLVDYQFDKQKKYNQVIQTQNICFKLSEHTNLKLVYFSIKKESKKYNLKIETSDISSENLKSIYEFIQYLFNSSI